MCLCDGFFTYYTYLHTSRTCQKFSPLFNAGFCQPVDIPSFMLKEYCVAAQSIIEKQSVLLQSFHFGDLFFTVEKRCFQTLISSKLVHFYLIFSEEIYYK